MMSGIVLDAMYNCTIIHRNTIHDFNMVDLIVCLATCE